MIDRYVLPHQHRVLLPIARALARHGVAADTITLVGFIFGLMSACLLALDLPLVALAAILINRFCDGLDGEVARQNGPTDRGAFLDIALDFFFYAAIPLGFAIAHPAQNALPAALLLVSFVGTGSSFLAFSLIAERRGLTANDYPQKGLYYLGGLTEGAETIGAFVLMCIWPEFFATIAYVFAGLCLLTALTRWYQGWNVFASARQQTQNHKENS